MGRLCLASILALVLGACSLPRPADDARPTIIIMATRNSPVVSAHPGLRGSTPLPAISQPAPTLPCPTHSADLELTTSSTTMHVEQSLTLTMTLTNDGCADIGLPKYSLLSWTEQPSLFAPAKPEPQTHYLGISPGYSDQAVFVLQALQPGSTELSASASFEVHLGYPGPAYWGTAASEKVVLQVEP